VKATFTSDDFPDGDDEKPVPYVYQAEIFIT
jgi:hypothetical protein